MKSLSIFFLCFGACIPSLSQNFNVDIDDMLTARADKTIPPDYIEGSFLPHWHKEMISLSWEIVKGSTQTTFGQKKELPGKSLIQTYSNVNCSEEPRSWEETFSMTSTEQASISITRSISSSTAKNHSVDMNAAINFWLIESGLDYSSSRLVTEEISLVNQRSVSTQETTTTKRTITLKSNPKEVLTVEVRQHILTYQVPFKVSFQVDGTATYDHSLKAGKLKGSGQYTYLLRDYLDENDRRFTTEGIVGLQQASELDIIFVTRPVTSVDCPIHSPVTTPDSK